MIKHAVLSYLYNKLEEQYPGRSKESYRVVLTGFIQYLQLVRKSPNNEVLMFSKSVDFVWHQFILSTREYAEFCNEYFGKFLHHVPSPTSNKDWSGDLELRKFFVESSILMGYDPFYPLGDFIELFRADVEMDIQNAIIPSTLSKMVLDDKVFVDNKKGKLFIFPPKYTEYEKFLSKVRYGAYSSNLLQKSVFKLTNPVNKLEYKPKGESNPTGNTLVDDIILLQTLTPMSDSISHTPRVESSPSNGNSSHSNHSHHSYPSSYSCGSSSHTSSHSSHSCASHSHSCSSSSCSSSNCGGSF